MPSQCKSPHQPNVGAAGCHTYADYCIKLGGYLIIIQLRWCGLELSADLLVTYTGQGTHAKAAPCQPQTPWHFWGLGSPSTSPASWASKVGTQEVCQPLGAVWLLCFYAFFFFFSFLRGCLAPLLLSLMTMVWLKNNTRKKSRAALSCELKIGKPVPLNWEDLEA